MNEPKDCRSLSETTADLSKLLKDSFDKLGLNVPKYTADLHHLGPLNIQEVKLRFEENIKRIRTLQAQHATWTRQDAAALQKFLVAHKHLQENERQAAALQQALDSSARLVADHIRRQGAEAVSGQQQQQQQAGSASGGGGGELRLRTLRQQQLAEIARHYRAAYPHINIAVYDDDIDNNGKMATLATEFFTIDVTLDASGEVQGVHLQLGDGYELGAEVHAQQLLASVRRSPERLLGIMDRLTREQLIQNDLGEQISARQLLRQCCDWLVEECQKSRTQDGPQVALVERHGLAQRRYHGLRLFYWAPPAALLDYAADLREYEASVVADGGGGGRGVSPPELTAHPAVYRARLSLDRAPRVTVSFVFRLKPALVVSRSILNVLLNKSGAVDASGAGAGVPAGRHTVQQLLCRPRGGVGNNGRATVAFPSTAAAAAVGIGGQDQRQQQQLQQDGQQQRQRGVDRRGSLLPPGTADIYAEQEAMGVRLRFAHRGAQFEGVVLSQVAFQHSNNILPILQALRQQLVFNELFASMFAGASASPPPPSAASYDSIPMVTVMTGHCPGELQVQFEHALGQSILQVIIESNGLLSAVLHQHGQPPASNEYATQLLRTSMSIPLTLRYLLLAAAQHQQPQ